MKLSIRLVLLLLLLFNFTLVETGMAQPVVRGDFPQQDTLIQYNKEKEKKKAKVNVEMGSAYANNGQFESINSYVAPSVGIPLSERLSMSVGISYSSIYFNSPTEIGSSNNAMSYGSIFLSGSYQVNEKLFVRGTAYKTFSLNPPQSSSLNSQFFDFSNQGVRMDAEYKVNEKFRIGVSVEYREQNCPSYFQNGLNSFGASPFRTHQFGTGF